MTYSARQVADALDVIVKSTVVSADLMLEAVGAALPGVMIGEFKAGVALRRFEIEIEGAEEYSRLAYLRKIDTYMVGVTDPDMTVGLVLRRAADAGDTWARDQVERWDSPDHLAYMALVAGAAQAHPDWSGDLVVGLVWKHASDTDDGDVDALIDWFQINHPILAKDIEDRARKAGVHHG